MDLSPGREMTPDIDAAGAIRFCMGKIILACDHVGNMPQIPHAPHIEQHFEASDMVRDVVIGMSDGLTVPFALAAGLSGTVSSTEIVVIAGLAEIAAGSIAMGLGGYLAARTDSDHYRSEREREMRE